MVSKYYPGLVLATLKEAREKLPELLQLVAAGRRVVITDGGKWLSELRPAPPTPEELTDKPRSDPGA